MTATSLIGFWVLAATGLLFLLVFVGTGYRLYRRRRRLYYKRLARINRIVGWSRIGSVGVGLVAAVRVAWRGNDYQTFLIAPCVWAVVVLFGVIGTDFFLFGHSRYSKAGKPKVRISVCLPWTSILLLLLLIVIGWSGVTWGRETASIDQRSHVFSWVLDGAFGWGVKTPYPGTFYTTPLFYCVPTVLAVGLAGIFLVLIRPAWLPAKKYAALDEGFRARTIRDITLICVGAVSAAIAMMGLDIAWAFGTLGPGSSERALVVAVAFFVGAWNLGQSFWVLANLIFLPPVAENRHLAEQIRAMAGARIESVSIPHEGEVIDLMTTPIEMAEDETAGTVEIAEIEDAGIVETAGTAGTVEVIEIADTEDAGMSETDETETEVAGTVETEGGDEVVEAIDPDDSAVSETSVSTEPAVAGAGEQESPTSGIAAEPVPAADEPVKHFTAKSSATHRPGFKPKKKKSRRR